MEAKGYGFVSPQAVDGFRADLAVDVEDGVDGVGGCEAWRFGVDGVGRCEAWRLGVDVDIRSPYAGVDHVADLGRDAEEACRGRGGGNFGIVDVSLRSMWVIGSGARGRPDLRKIGDDESGGGVWMIRVSR